jgi:hypothetical protein
LIEAHKYAFLAFGGAQHEAKEADPNRAGRGVAYPSEIIPERRATSCWNAARDQIGMLGEIIRNRWRHFSRSPPTLHWREMDSNFRFRVRCKRGLRRKSPASAACVVDYLGLPVPCAMRVRFRDFALRLS